MDIKKYILIFFSAIVLQSCAGDNYKIMASENFTNMRPSTIAVLPILNETVDLDAPKVFPKYIKQALTARGYLVTDQELIENLLKAEDIKLAGEVNAIPDAKLGEALNAQALLTTTITAWETVYVGVYSSVTVGVRFDLVDAKTSELLWRAEDEEKDTSFALDKDSAKVTAAFAAFQAYEPYANRLVFRLLEKLPPGPFGTTQLPKVKIKKIEKKRR